VIVIGPIDRSGGLAAHVVMASHRFSPNALSRVGGARASGRLSRRHRQSNVNAGMIARTIDRHSLREPE
jgi:hypothetical protein